jgi:Ni/Co efflux regulator RcnB
VFATAITCFGTITVDGTVMALLGSTILNFICHKKRTIMKKVLFMLLGVTLTAGAMAQTAEKKQEVKKEMKDLHKDVKEKREEKKEMGKALTHGKFKKAIHERKDVRAQKRHINKDAEELEEKGVKHPVTKVKHQIRSEKEAKKAKD